MRGPPGTCPTAEGIRNMIRTLKRLLKIITRKKNEDQTPQPTKEIPRYIFMPCWHPLKNRVVFVMYCPCGHPRFEKEWVWPSESFLTLDIGKWTVCKGCGTRYLFTGAFVLIPPLGANRRR